MSMVMKFGDVFKDEQDALKHASYQETFHGRAANGFNDPIHVEDIVANSFKDYHVKGFDYLCIKRSSHFTQKIYFFDGDVSSLPEVVNPHDHRYYFHTKVLAGCSQNSWYKPHENGEVYEEFDFSTPLNGGSGFSHSGTRKLMETKRDTYRPGQSYGMAHDEIHTIRMVENETVLYLLQRSDEVPVGVPTKTFTKSKEPPALSGLYSRFSADEAVRKLRNFSERSGINFNII